MHTYYDILHIKHLNSEINTCRSYNIWSDTGIESETLSRAITHATTCATKAVIR